MARLGPARGGIEPGQAGRQREAGELHLEALALESRAGPGDDVDGALDRQQVVERLEVDARRERANARETRRRHAVATPKAQPTSAVKAMASAPQNVTRSAPRALRAPPARAATVPRPARKTSDIAAMMAMRP